MKEYYKDEKGYLRIKPEHSNLLHRQIAYTEIYLKNKDKYSLPFSSYDIHHRDRDKTNNRVENLELVTRKEHMKIHGIKSRDWTAPIIILWVTVIIVLIAFVMNPTGDKKPEKNSTPSACSDLGCPSSAVLVGNTNSNIYHKCECDWAQKINKENRVCFFSEQDALNKGYRKSKTCYEK